MTTHITSGKVAIVGAAHTDRIGKLPEHSRLSIHAEAARNALADAGLSLKDVDGIFSAVATPNEISEYLNITPRYVDGTSVGGLFLYHDGGPCCSGDCSRVLRCRADHSWRKRQELD